MPRLLIQEYQVGWVCALPKELTAARAMLDEVHDPYTSQVPHDNNSYILGSIHGHNVVMACLPAGEYGTVSAATVAANMLRTFTGIRFSLMVGIGGGIPNPRKGVDIRLGDVVVSRPDGTHGGVVQYDLRKNLGNGVFEQKGVLPPPPSVLLTALANLESQHEMYGNQILETISAVTQQYPRLTNRGFAHPGLENDVLFCGNIQTHQGGNHCPECQNGIVNRQPREAHHPDVHYGIVASGNELIKNASARDQLGREFRAKCVEMEAAGLMNDLPCIVIRGICDYADSHKNDVWQEYAAITAASFAKELLSIVVPAQVDSAKHVTETMSGELPKYNLGLNLFDAPDLTDNLFIGRQTEIQRMEAILQPQSDNVGSSRKVLVLGGMGGVGKTQLATFYAKQHRTDYTSVFWLDATSEVSLKMSFRNVAYRALPPETTVKLDDEQIYVSVSNWLSEPDNARWLIIFDNYDDPDLYSLQKYYPSVTHGSIIITTRQPGGVNGEKLPVLSMNKENDSLRILATRSGRDNVESDPDALLLARRLDGYPLALATAGAFLNQSSVSFSNYLQRYNARWKVIDSMEELADYPLRTLYTTWDLSFTRIEEQSPRAAHLLRFLAYFDHKDIWFHLFRGGQGENCPTWFTELTNDEFTFEDTMRVLTRYCLVEAHHQRGSYSLHTCVHDWTLNGLNQQIDNIKYWLAFDCVANNMDVDDYCQLSSVRYRRFTGHAMRLLHGHFQVALDQSESVRTRSDAIAKLAEFLNQQIQYDAEQMYIQALHSREEELGPDHMSTLDMVINLGSLYADQGKLAMAENMYLRALQRYEEVLGPDHMSIFHTVNNLGSLYANQGKLVEAEKMYARALQGNEKTRGLDHTSTLQTVDNLGVLYAKQGKLVEAEKMYTRALQGKEKTLGPDHILTLQTVNNLGLLYFRQDKLAAAKKMFIQALQGYEKALGAEVLQSYLPALVTMATFGDLYSQTDRKHMAGVMYTRALSGYRAIHGPSSKLCREIEDRLQALQLPAR